MKVLKYNLRVYAIINSFSGICKTKLSKPVSKPRKDKDFQCLKVRRICKCKTNSDNSVQVSPYIVFCLPIGIHCCLKFGGLGVDIFSLFFVKRCCLFAFRYLTHICGFKPHRYKPLTRLSRCGVTLDIPDGSICCLAATRFIS